MAEAGRDTLSVQQRIDDATDLSQTVASNQKNIRRFIAHL